MFSVRKALILLLPLLAGCAANDVRVISSAYQAPRLDAELNFFVANHSPYATNHLYVLATKTEHNHLNSARVYWKENRTLLDYVEPEGDAPPAMAWTGGLKLDQDTVDSRADIGGSTYLVTHAEWVRWMDECLSRGQLHTILQSDARKMYPSAQKVEPPATSTHRRGLF